MKINLKEMFNKIRYKDVENSAKEVSYFAYDLAEWITIAGTAILMSTFLGLIVLKIMAVGGIPAVLADLMASTCTGTGIPCDFNLLLGGVGLSLVVITTFFITTMKLTQFQIDFAMEEENSNPCESYNDQQLTALKVIQAVDGQPSYNRIANFLDIPYTTFRSYMDKFEADGYVKTQRNGQGSRFKLTSWIQNENIK